MRKVKYVYRNEKFNQLKTQRNIDYNFETIDDC